MTSQSSCVVKFCWIQLDFHHVSLTICIRGGYLTHATGSSVLACFTEILTAPFKFIEKGGKHRIFSLRVVTWDANMFSWSQGIKLVFFLIDCSFSQAIRLSISEKNISIMLADASPSADGVRNKIVLIRGKYWYLTPLCCFLKIPFAESLKHFRMQGV